MPAWYKQLVSGSRKGSKSKLNDSSNESANNNLNTSLPAASSYNSPTKPNPAAKSAADGQANTSGPVPIAGTKSGVDAIEPSSIETAEEADAALLEHTAKYGSSPSHAARHAKDRDDTERTKNEAANGPNGEAESPEDGITASTSKMTLNEEQPSSVGSTSSVPPTGQARSANGQMTSPILSNPLSSSTAQQQNGSSGGKNDPKTFDIDDMINRLLDVGYSGKISKSVVLKNAEITAICQAAREVFLSQPPLIELSPPVKIVGDVHGQYSDLIRMFEMCGFPPSANYLFLGDYVDRGKQSLETILLLLCYKIKYPENFFLLRGNHECANVTRGQYYSFASSDYSLLV